MPAWRKRFAWTAAFTLLAQSTTPALAACQVDQQGSFKGEGVRLARAPGLQPAARFAVYRAPLAVNTDGAPTSYHPEDFLGERLAINRIDHGIAIRRAGGGSLMTEQNREVFDRWRASPGWVVPPGFTISWRNVIVAGPDGRPCIFSTGSHAGYFGSLTALQNGLSGGAAGECQAANQLDQRVVPAIVLRGGAGSPLQQFGARIGDLVVATNPVTRVVVSAVAGDSGDGNRIGEGSIALNMALLSVTQQPRTYEDAKRLDTGTAAMVVAVLPQSAAFRRERPYNAENLARRLDAWAAERGYGNTQGLANAALECSNGL